MKIGILGKIDLLIFLPLLFLSGFSLSIIYSINPSLFSSQLLFFLLGFLIFFIFSLVDFEFYKGLSLPVYLLSLFLLLLSFFGPNIRGATRWIEIFSFRVQPVEFIKPLLSISLASFLSFYSPKKFKSIIFYFLTLLPFLITIFFQPDFGNLIIVLGLSLGIILGAGLGLGNLLIIFFGFFLLLPFGLNNLRDYQKLRIISFLNPSFDPQGTNYNSIQAMIAVGSGMIFGRGLGRGTQSHLRFLPENHTDFIFASLGEELGLLGIILLLSCYFILLFRILRIAEGKEKDLFARAFSLGIFSQLLLQIFINIGMNVGLLPITGITLPFISYGGSSILASFLSLGIIQNMAKKEEFKSTLVIR